MKGASKAMRANFEYRTSQYAHPVFRGMEREDEVRKFLEEYFPKKFSVGHGFVVSTSKDHKPSSEQDVIIYDAINCPIFNSGRTSQIFPVESIYATIQVKTKLDKEKLKAALENIKSVKELPRVPEGPRQTDLGIVVGGVPPPPIGMVFAFESVKLETLKGNLTEIHSDVDPQYWINLVCIHDKGIIFYGDPKSLILNLNPNNTTKLETLHIMEETLYTFYVILLGYLNSSQNRFVDIRKYAEVLTSPIQEAIDMLR
jgi:hypothetical protein